jgi:hypothetical protein
MAIFAARCASIHCPGCPLADREHDYLLTAHEIHRAVCCEEDGRLVAVEAGRDASGGNRSSGSALPDRRSAGSFRSMCWSRGYCQPSLNFPTHRATPHWHPILIATQGFMGRFFVQRLTLCWTTLGQTATAREGHEVCSWFRACGALAANTPVLCNDLLQHGTSKSERSTICKSCRFLRGFE